MEHSDEIKGTVERFLFQNTENGYSVLYLTVGTQTIVVKGYLPTLQAGHEAVFHGSWTTHPKFGKQFEAKKCTTHLPTSVHGLKKYLGSGLIKGIGPTYAEKLVDHFGQQVLEIIDANPRALSQVPGIGPKRAAMIIESWKDQKHISTVMVYLQDKGISTAFATKIYKAYGQNAIALITQNPYRLAEDIWGIGFKMADQIAQAVGIAHNSLHRVKSGLLYCIGLQVGQGHLYVELQALKKMGVELLELEGAAESESVAPDYEPLLKLAFHDLYNENKIKLISHHEHHFITLSQHYQAEKGVALLLQRLLKQPVTHALDIQAIYQSLRSNSDAIILNEEQQRGILTCLQNKVTIITGGPGTGKTTLIKKLLQILDANSLSYKLAAPTGRAAKRITQGTGKLALTVHRLLEFDFLQRNFTKNEQNAIQADFLIIDEASMIDIFLAYAIVKAVPFTGHLILIGDVDQLPSVGAGNFLNDLIASKQIPTIRLQEIFRQAQDSLIVVNAHNINNGIFPVSHMPDAKKDFIYIKEDDPTNVSALLTQLLQTNIKRFGIESSETMVLVPMNRGLVGTQSLNAHLQSVLNPHETKSLQHNFYTYKIGDRVMQIRNNYDKAVFNGDTGTIEDINISDKMVHVRYHEKIVEYEASELDELVLAYAISIHKSQGSEYQAVIIPIFMQHFTLLQRNLIYTAVTRAKKLCILIGQARAIAMAIKNNKNIERITFLQHYLTSDLQCR